MKLSIFETWAESHDRPLNVLSVQLLQPFHEVIEKYSHVFHEKYPAVQNMFNVANAIDIAGDGSTSLVEALKVGAIAQVKILKPALLDTDEIIEAFKDAAVVLSYNHPLAAIELEEAADNVSLMSFISARVEAQRSVSR